MNYVWAFVVGGAICVIGQLFIDYTKLTPARILTGYVVAGVVLSAVGVTSPWPSSPGRGQCAAAGVRASAGAKAWCRPWIGAACQAFYRRADRCRRGIAASLIFAVAAALVGKSRDQN